MIRIASHVLVAGTAGQIKRVCRRYTIARWCVAYLRACPFLPEPYTSRQGGWLSLSDAYGIIPGRKNSVICVIRAESLSHTYHPKPLLQKEGTTLLRIIWLIIKLNVQSSMFTGTCPNHSQNCRAIWKKWGARRWYSFFFLIFVEWFDFMEESQT